MTTSNTSATAPKSRFRLHRNLWIGAAMLMAFPALATVMGRSDWGAEDFAAMALLLALLCAVIEAAMHFLDAPRWRIGGIMLAVLMFVTVWVHFAAGIF
jgi:hypothetical protein